MSHRFNARRGRLTLLTVMLMLALAALACGGGTNAAEPVAEPTAEPIVEPTVAPTTAPEPTSAPPAATKAPASDSAAAGVSLDIVNESTSSVCYVFLSPSDSTEWGGDQLGEGTIIDAGTTFTLTDIPAGLYDLRADDCSNNTLGQEFGVELASGSYTWTVLADTVNLTLINNSSSELCYLYVSASDDTEWGPDQFGESTTLQSGSQFTVEGIPPGSYDMLVESCEGATLEEYGLDLSVDFEYTVND